MNPEEILTSEQKDNLKTWAVQRDALLTEISILRSESGRLQKKNEDLAFSNTDIENRMVEVRARIEELKIKEAELPLLISKEVSSLQLQRTTLESEINWMKQMIEVLTLQKTSFESDVSFALSVFNDIKGNTLVLDKIVDKVTSVSQDNTNKINSLVNNLASSLEEIIAVNRKNVIETNIVIEKLPAMLMEAQKRGVINIKI